MNLFDKIEQKRQEFNASRDKKGYGTLPGLAEVIKKRRMAALDKVYKAQSQEEKSDAK